MNNLDESARKMETSEIIASFWEKLPAMAKHLIQKTQDLGEERNKNFLDNPDDYLEHQPNWHQWGIITHTKMFEHFYRKEIPKYLDQWGIQDKFRAHMSQNIDGISKYELLNMSIPFHDLGKFTERQLNHEKDGSSSVSFYKHEAASGRIIRTAEFSGMLKESYDLTDEQIEYIARCAELHYELAIVRDAAKKSAMGYTIAFSQSEAFRERAKQLMAEYTDFQLEVGVLFLADSMAKTDIRIDGETDGQIEDQDSLIKDLLEKRGLNPQLIKAVKQFPINRAIAENYLKAWAEDCEVGGS